MRLIKFKVQNFRSVVDSGWIDAEQVTALIGVNVIFPRKNGQG